jgi:hypothetical protein
VKKISKVLAGWLPEHSTLNQQIDELEKLAIRGDAEAVVKVLCEMVPTFRPRNQVSSKQFKNSSETIESSPALGMLEHAHALRRK